MYYNEDYPNEWIKLFEVLKSQLSIKVLRFKFRAVKQHRGSEQKNSWTSLEVEQFHNPKFHNFFKDQQAIGDKIESTKLIKTFVPITVKLLSLKCLCEGAKALQKY